MDPPTEGHDAPWHFLYLTPLPQGHGSLRPIFLPPEAASNLCRLARASWHSAQVHAGGWSLYQLVRSFPMTIVPPVGGFSLVGEMLLSVLPANHQLNK